MKLVVGLGNPGREYEATRHNIGFMIIDRLAEKWAVTVSKNQNKALVGEGKFNGEKVVLVKPMTYMNLSGEAVGALMRWHKLDPADIIVVYDDLDLQPGKLRIRGQGSAGGHNGIKSIIQHLGTDIFPRLKVGIGRPHPGQDSASYVLNRFNSEERDLMVQTIALAAEAVEAVITHGVTQASNVYNGS
ncbi:MAG: aminoacyl-tRNA hydrolase [Firmicutes bacterium]|nr:aminoacyl-tRNA hydrolase [Bacillota bacterium]